MRQIGFACATSVGLTGVYSLMISVAGMIAAAAGDERVITRPTEHAGRTTNLLLFGGPIPRHRGPGET